MASELLLPNTGNAIFGGTNLENYAGKVKIPPALWPTITTIITNRSTLPLQKLYDLKALLYEEVVKPMTITPPGYFAKPLSESQKTLIAEYLARNILTTGASIPYKNSEIMNSLLKKKTITYKLVKGGARKSRRRRRHRHTRRR